MIDGRLTARRLATTNHFRGCLLGGAVGDALGAPVEITPLSVIRRRYGNDGIRDMDGAYGRVGAITDDTQMALWTAEGLLRAITRAKCCGIDDVPLTVLRAYYRWLDSQHLPMPRSEYPLDGGWLYEVEALRHRRSPGRTCIDALASGKWGTTEDPLNDSKGCGTVMRIAPVGLLSPTPDSFRSGCEISALTHGHPSGYLAGGFLSQTLAHLVVGADLPEAVDASLTSLREWESHEEVEEAVLKAVDLATIGEPTAAAVEDCGGGWVAEEALAISLYCALVHSRDFEAGVVLAVNHSGDSDSTGAITGNILGLILGEEAIPDRWLEPLELREEITRLADDMVVGWRDDEEWGELYPKY